MARKYLTQTELEEEINKLFESDDDDVKDPDYLNSTSSESEWQDEPVEQDDIDEDKEDEENVPNSVEAASLVWSHNVQDIPRDQFTGNEGIQGHLAQNTEATPMDIFFSLIDDSVLELMVRETNRYARQMLDSETITREHRMNRWKETNKDEMKKFLGVLLFMGLVDFPTIECYWKRDDLYYHPLMHKINISYNRFSLLLRNWHFVDNSLHSESNNRLYKISSLADAIVGNIQNAYIPGQTVTIDESMILFRGRLKFRQYNPGKANKYGIKVYKLCNSKGFVWNFKVYCGNDPTLETLDKPGSVVVTLGEKLLNEGRIFITDNWYTSIPLALYLNKYNTHLCGTLRKNKRFLPKEVVDLKLKRGESTAMQANNITILKWHDKRDVLCLSTCEGDGMTTLRKRQNLETTKPNIIMTYNKGKQGIDVSDQKSSYYSCLRKSLIWYKKVAVELICGVVIVNSCIIYNELHTKKPLRQLHFIEQLIRQIFEIQNTASIPATSSSHYLQEIPRKEDGKIRRKRCHPCYNKNKEDRDSDFAAKHTKQVSTECQACEKAYCLQCFNENH